MVTESDMTLAEGRKLHIYDTQPIGGESLAIFWHHGTPNTGAPPEPLLAWSEAHNVRWIAHDRPGYGGSDPLPGRTVGSVAEDVTAIADSLNLSRFAVMGHSGGASHALACAAALPDRVRAAVCISGLAPADAPDLSWFAGMDASGAAKLQAAQQGRAELVAHVDSAEWDPAQFTDEDHAALRGPWSWLISVVRKANETDTGGSLDDDLAYARPWGCDFTQATAPVLLVHGARDRIVPSLHAQWLAEHLPAAELWVNANDGHISILHSAQDALDWLLKAA